MTEGATAPTHMRVTIIGSGTLLPDPHHSSASHWVEFGDVRILLDCGSGALHGMARERLSWRGLSHLVITHFHTDHTADLSPILFALRHGTRPPRTDETLTLLGPRGLDAHVDALARAHGSYVRDPGFPVKVVELAGGEQWADPAGRFTLHVHSTPHTDVSIGCGSRPRTAPSAIRAIRDPVLRSGISSPGWKRSLPNAVSPIPARP